MSANSQTASGIADGSLAPLALMPPRGLGGSLAELGLVATARLRIGQFLEALKGAPHKQPEGDGSQEKLEDQLAADNMWNDPALWILMMR
jgi:hypothetical protein